MDLYKCMHDATLPGTRYFIILPASLSSNHSQWDYVNCSNSTMMQLIKLNLSETDVYNAKFEINYNQQFD